MIDDHLQVGTAELLNVAVAWHRISSPANMQENISRCKNTKKEKSSRLKNCEGGCPVTVGHLDLYGLRGQQNETVHVGDSVISVWLKKKCFGGQQDG